MKKSKPIDAELVELYCDKCGARMIPTGYVTQAHPTRYQYQCVKCGYQEMRRHEYPRVIWRERGANE